MRRRLVACLVVALLFGACGDTEPEPAIPHSSPSPSSTEASAASGDLLVYTHQVRMESDSARGFPVLEVVAYDIGAQREVSAFEVGGLNAYPLQVGLAGDRIIANLESKIVVYDLDGGNETVIAAAGEGHFIGAGGSPDGTMVAYTEQTSFETFPYEANTRIVVELLADGAEILSLRQSDPRFAGYRGQIAIPTWRADGSGVVLSGYTYSEAPGGLATVMLDGTVRLHDFSGYAFLAPTSDRVGDDDGVLCDLGSPGENHEIRIVGLDTGATTATLRDDDLTLQWREWAPDGSELLVERYGLRSVPDMTCPQRDAASEWVILPADGSDVVTVGDPYEARGRWYKHDLRYECEGEVTFEAYCNGADGLIAPLTVSVDGTAVGEVEQFTFLGFTDDGEP